MKAVARKLLAVVCLCDKVQLKTVLGLDELRYLKLADLAQPWEHEVVCVDHQVKVEGKIAFCDDEVVGVQVLNDHCQVVLWDSFQLNDPFELPHLLMNPSIKVVREVAFFEAVAAIKHCFEIVRPCAQNRTVNSDLLVRVKDENDVVKEVEIPAFDHISEDSLVQADQPILWRQDAFSRLVEFLKAKEPL